MARTKDAPAYTSLSKLITTINDHTGISWEHEPTDRYSGRLVIGKELAQIWYSVDHATGRWFITSVIGLDQSPILSIHNITGAFRTGRPLVMAEDGKMKRYVMAPVGSN